MPPHLIVLMSYFTYLLNGTIGKHFPRRRRFSKIFNTNTTKLSYSSAANMENLIKQQNKSVLNKEENSSAHLCNCRNKEN